MYPTGKAPHFLLQRPNPPRHHVTQHPLNTNSTHYSTTQHLTVYDWDPGHNRTSLSVTQELRGHVTSFYENFAFEKRLEGRILGKIIWFSNPHHFLKKSKFVNGHVTQM